MSVWYDVQGRRHSGGNPADSTNYWEPGGQQRRGTTTPGVPDAPTTPKPPAVDPVAAAGQPLPGEDEYYNRQYGNVSRILAARQRASTTGLYDALNARGFGQSSEVARGAGQISQAYGSSLADALGNIQNNQFAARERRIENAQNQQFQSGMADKNFQYQLQLLKTQLASQGHSDLLGIIDSLISGAAQYFGGGGSGGSSGGGGGSNSGGVDYPDTYRGGP